MRGSVRRHIKITDVDSEFRNAEEEQHLGKLSCSTTFVVNNENNLLELHEVQAMLPESLALAKELRRMSDCEMLEI